VTGEVGQGADLEPRQAETLGDLGECAALYRDRPAAELAVQALTRGLAVDELVARVQTRRFLSSTAPTSAIAGSQLVCC
jgi:hypothetical protein